MANNCNNYIKINGNKTEIKALYELISDDVTQNGYDKYPALLSKYTKGANDPRWFDMYVTLEDENQITITGDTAWCPALEVFTEISKLNPSFEIHYEYEEGGCDFAGYADIKEGEITDNCFTYWKGLVATDRVHALDYAIVNQLEDYENEQELISSDMYTAFETDEQKVLLQEYLKYHNKSMKKTRKNYEAHLNQLHPVYQPFMEYLCTRSRKARRTLEFGGYGFILRKHDPATFIKGFKEWDNDPLNTQLRHYENLLKNIHYWSKYGYVKEKVIMIINELKTNICTKYQK